MVRSLCRPTGMIGADTPIAGIRMRRGGATLTGLARGAGRSPVTASCESRAPGEGSAGRSDPQAKRAAEISTKETGAASRTGRRHPFEDSLAFVSLPVTP